MPPLDPEVADLARSDPLLSPYNQTHAIPYMRLLDADGEGADWREVARICCTSTQTVNLVERGGPSRAISPAPDG